MGGGTTVFCVNNIYLPTNRAGKIGHMKIKLFELKTGCGRCQKWMFVMDRDVVRRRIGLVNLGFGIGWVGCVRVPSVDVPTDTYTDT